MMLGCLITFLISSSGPLDPEESLSLIAGDLKIERGFRALTKKAPVEKELLTDIWANEMWAFKNGGICRRTEDKYRSLKTWTEQYRYIELNPLEDVVRERSPITLEKRIQTLSPTEKYDLIMGNLDAPLTRFFWQYQKQLHEKNELSSWRGVCEGSASASAFWRGREPIRSLKIPSRILGLNVPLSALDIKALGAIAFSQFQIEIPIIGSNAAINLNPATVFLAILNFGAIHGIPMIIDKEPKLPVWNVPIQAYRYRILKTVDRKRDPFNSVRHPEATEIREMEMNLTYADVNRDGIRDEGKVPAPIQTLKLKFDLELNCEHPDYPDDCKIVGGEWREKTYPDFLYLILESQIPWSAPEKNSSFNRNAWTVDSASKELKEIPNSWGVAAAEAGKQGQVLWSLVEQLFLFSSR